MIPDDWFVVIFRISEVLLFPVLSEVRLVSDVKYVLVAFYLLFLKLSQVHRIQLVSDNWLIIKFLDAERRKLLFNQLIEVVINYLLRVSVRAVPYLFISSSVFSKVSCRFFVLDR